MELKNPPVISNFWHLVRQRRGVLPIPDICQFWYTATLLRPVKKAPKRALICDKMAKIGQNSMQIENCTLPSVLAAVTNISYADCLAGLIPVLNNLTF